MIALAPAAGRVAKLLPKLGSGTDAEVAGAARAIVAALHKHGLDLHDLAQLAPPPPAAPAETYLSRVMAMRDLLHPSERDFITTLTRLAGRGPLRLTARQFAWLSAIHDRLQEPHPCLRDGTHSASCGAVSSARTGR